jgi:hypothetical protein
MAKKIYSFNYDFHKAELKFEVDLDVFTSEMAYETLTFFSWDYDHEADPIDEVMKKYAIAVLWHDLYMGYSSLENLRSTFDSEGFGGIDGSIGITLLDFEPFQFDEFHLEMEVNDA